MIRPTSFLNLRIVKPWHTHVEDFKLGEVYQFSEQIAEALLRGGWAVHADPNDAVTKAKAPEMVKVVGEQGGLF